MIVYHTRCDRCGLIAVRPHYSEAKRDAERHERAHVENDHICRVLPRNTLATEQDEDLPETIRQLCPACVSGNVERVDPERSLEPDPVRALFRCLVCTARFVLMRPRPRWA